MSAAATATTDRFGLRLYSVTGGRTTKSVAGAVLAAIVLLSYAWDAPGILLYGNVALSNQAVTSSGDTARQACFTLLFLGIATSGVHARGASFLLRLPIALVPLLAWCWLSLIWAIEPAIALRRLAFTTLIILSVAYTVELLSVRQVIGLLLKIFVLIIMADWLAVAIFPLAVHQAGETDQNLIGNWRGIHNHKNEAGAFCAMCFIIVFYEAIRVRSWITGVALCIVCAIFLDETHSKTSSGFVVVSLLIGLMAKISYQNPAIRRATAIAAVILCLAALALVSDPLSPLMKLMDDPAALTGRVQIWPVLWSYVLDHPWFGSGYGSFWAIGDASPIFHYGSGWVTTVDHSHNGYLQILIQTGVVGLLLALIALVFQPFHKLFTKPVAKDLQRSMVCAVLAFGCLHDLLETSLLDRASPTWVVMLVMYCLLAKRDKSSGEQVEPAMCDSSHEDTEAGLHASLRPGTA